MDKKFITGTVFGLALGIGIGFTSPMIGATDIKLSPSKTKKSSSTTAQQPVTQMNNDLSASMGEAVKILNEINSSLKENSQQNKEMIENIKKLSSQNSLGLSQK